MGKPVLFDMDGVLADFIAGFTRLGNKMYGSPTYSSHQQFSWDGFDGLQKWQVETIWEYISKDKTFWATLPALVSEDTFKRIYDLAKESPVYFVTARHTKGAKEQTEWWLRWHGLDNPTVITTPLKGEFADLVGAGYAIDDKAENAWCVSWLTRGKTQSYLLNRPYNETEGILKIGSSKTLRINSVESYLDIVEAGL